MDLRLSSVAKTDEFMSVFVSTNTIGYMTHGSDWLPHIHYIRKATVDRLSGTKAKNHYNFKSEFETRRDKVVVQDFERQNDLMSRPQWDSTPLDTNMTNVTT